jgi:hypothetical protein
MQMRKATVKLIAPVNSRLSICLRQRGWEFSGISQADRGDGYGFLQKLCKSQHVDQILAFFAKRNVTAWVTR